MVKKLSTFLLAGVMIFLLSSCSLISTRELHKAFDNMDDLDSYLLSTPSGKMYVDGNNIMFSVVDGDTYCYIDEEDLYCLEDVGGVYLSDIVTSTQEEFGIIMYDFKELDDVNYRTIEDAFISQSVFTGDRYYLVVYVEDGYVDRLVFAATNGLNSLSARYKFTDLDNIEVVLPNYELTSE